MKKIGDGSWEYHRTHCVVRYTEDAALSRALAYTYVKEEMFKGVTLEARSLFLAHVVSSAGVDGHLRGHGCAPHVSFFRRAVVRVQMLSVAPRVR